MNDENTPGPSAADTAREKASEAGRQCDSALEEIKDNFGLLLELRDRKIRELERKLAEEATEAAKPCLLVVDDAESTSAILHWYLDGKAVEVVCVAGSQALEQIRSQSYDAIMLEASTCVAADVDGMDLCRELGKKGLGDTVIVMSSRPGDRVKNAVEQAGAMFLRKPFKREEVVQIVRNVPLRRKK